jgi:putative FmdB family regulatory protein
MPIYEYRCEQGHTFEVMQRMADDPVASCQTCSAPVERVFHPVAVHFKGSGFYNTDYGTRKRSRELKESGEGSGKSDSSTSTDSSSKGESTPSPSKSESTSSTKPTKSDQPRT